MKNLVGRAVWLLVLTVVWLSLNCVVQNSKAQETVKVASPAARSRNHAKMNKLIADYNAHAAEFNRLYGDKTEWQVEPEKAAEQVAEMALKLTDMYKVLTEFDEESGSPPPRR